MRWLAAALLLAACQGAPSDGQLSKLDLSGLPKGFLLGTATAAHQIEGGNDNDWTDWENTSFPDGGPHIANGDKSGQADDSWNRFGTDLGLMQQLHANGYRFSIEWSRLEPQRGQWDAAAAARYRDWLTQLRANGIEPMVTLFHFTLPKWVAAQGGFESDQTVDDFVAFTRRAAMAFGDLVDVWCPINEPNVYAYSAYLTGEFPPGKMDSGLAADVLARLLLAQARSGHALRETDTVDADLDGHATWIGTAHHVRVFQPASSSTLDTTVAGLTDDFFNESTPRALIDGRLKLFVPGVRDIDRYDEELAQSIDWLGINYYTRDTVRTDLFDPTFSKQYVPNGAPTSQLGWDTYPQGMYLMLRRFDAYGVPLYVTENGIADDTDTRRVEYLTRHLEALALAAHDGADVRGYFHWSLLDNFEWAQGFAPRFGLFRVDYASPDFTRSPTKAVDTFITAAGQLPR